MSQPTRIVAVVVLAGVVLRAALLTAAAQLPLVADESSYAYLGLAWQRFGFLPDLTDFLWPPLYPGLLATAFSALGAQGLIAVKLLQVLLSTVVGASTAAIAGRVFGPRAAVIAAALWAVHVPMAAYTHLVRPETIFLALLGGGAWLALRAFDEPADDPGSWLRLAGAGACLGAALLVKQVALPLAGAALLWIAVAPRQGRANERALRAAVFGLAFAAFALPWSVRNADVYGRVVLGGSTLGRNLHHGVNGHYRNFDYEAQGLDMQKLYADEPGFLHAFISDPSVPAWPSSRAANVIDRSAENGESARRWAREHPGFFLRSRIKKLADWVTPLSFFTASVGRGIYDETPLSGTARRPLVLAASATTGIVLVAGFLGLAVAPCERRHRVFLLGLLACIAATAPIVSMSRYRLPAEPFLIVAAAGWLVHARHRAAPTRASLAAAAAAVILLVAAWVMNAREIALVLRNALG